MHFLNQFLSILPCHRLPDRCISIGNYKMAICARCFGFFAGLPVGFLLGALDIFMTRWFILPFLVPMLIDAETQRLGTRYSNNLLRVTTGFLFGTGIGLFIYLWIVSDISMLINS